MPRKTRNPGAGRRQGFDLELVVQAVSEIEATAPTSLFQGGLAVRRLMSRFRLPPATALAVAEANAWGRS